MTRTSTSSEAKRKPAEKATGAMTRALHGLKTLIINGELSPGVQIRQEEMAEQLSVSRVPLREAMNVLADQGILFHRPHQGYFVTKRAPGEHAQIRRMLHLLENELMTTIRWPDKAVISELRTLNDEMRACVKTGDVRQLIVVNRQFHFRIFCLSPNTLILEEVRRLWSMIEPSMWSKYDRAADREKTLVEHDRIIAALVARDRALCVSEMVEHRYAAEAGLPIELPGVDAGVVESLNA
jgi:DNA-binding GntR family transcriptional regulator